MRGELAGRTWRAGGAIREALRALARLEAMGEERPIVVAYHPVARVNPYEALLYRRSWQNGLAPIALNRLDDLEGLLPVVDLGARLVLHIHWTNVLLQKAKDIDDARRELEAFVRRLDAFAARGGHVAWTVHNVLPHESPWPELDAELQQALVDRCSAVHILARETVAIAAPVFSIPPDRVLHVPHPNYIGAYEDVIGRAQARHELGIEPDEIVYAFVGALRPYKGLDDLLAAFDAVAATPGPPRRLIVAGAPVTDPTVARFLERCAVDPRILLVERKIPGGEMQVFLRAADLAVLPYQRSLNSGVLLLALSFGLPVVVANVGGASEIVEPAFGRTFEGGDAGALSRALVAADELLGPDAAAAALEAARRYDPDSLSDAFARGLRGLIDARDAARSGSESAGSESAGSAGPGSEEAGEAPVSAR